MKNKKILCLLSIVFVLCMLFAVGCGSQKGADDAESVVTEEAGDASGSELSYEGSLALKGLAEEMEIAYNDIYAMEAVTTEIHHISSSGEEFTDTVTGVLLDTILSEKGDSQKNYTAIRFKAGDGYEVTVPADIISEKDIILAYDFNGEGLEEKEQPLRVAIDGVRSMYLVSNLTEIEFSNEAVVKEEAVEKQIVLLETAVSKLNSEDFMYYDSNDKAVLVADLLTAHSLDLSGDVAFVASDGYEKVEAPEVVKQGYIKYTGEDAPLFTGKDLPKGMNIKYIMKMEAGPIAFISVASSMETLEKADIDALTGVKLSAFIAAAGIEADNYTLTADDGYSVDVAKESLADAIVYIGESGTASVQFTEAYPKNVNVNNLMSISAKVQETDEQPAEDQAASMEAWTVVVEGLSDGSFDLTSEKAGRKLTLVALHTERMKNDVKYPEDWEGYKVLDILSFLHVEDFNAVTVIAGDGYEYELTKDLVDDETILAVIKDGEAMGGDNKVQLVQNTEFATSWVKDVVKIIVK